MPKTVSQRMQKHSKEKIKAGWLKITCWFDPDDSKKIKRVCKTKKLDKSEVLRLAVFDLKE